MNQFVSRYDNLSNDRGTQFRFYCDKCGRTHVTEFSASVSGITSNVLSTLARFVGGTVGTAALKAREVDDVIRRNRSPDAAFNKAVESAKQFFRQCSRCGKWVCLTDCWNNRASTCKECTPDSVSQAYSTVLCPSCHAKNPPESKYCTTCGTTLASTTAAGACPNCGGKIANEKFCPACGRQVRSG